MSNEKGKLINNEMIVREYIEQTDTYKEYMAKFDITESQQIDIDEIMRRQGMPGHYFAIRFPGWEAEGGYIVFESILPPMSPLYQAVKFGTPGALQKLVEILPSYYFLAIDDLDREHPTMEEIKEVLHDFLKLWIDLNTIDSNILLWKNNMEGIKDERLSEDHEGSEPEDTEEA